MKNDVFNATDTAFRRRDRNILKSSAMETG